jgi:hypothetical protein
MPQFGPWFHSACTHQYDSIDSGSVDGECVLPYPVLQK